MAHGQQADFCKSVKIKFPQKFKGVSILDVGSLDINGNNRYLFEDYQYTGIDLGPGKNVDIVCIGSEFKSPIPFDVVISTECFEHDKMYKETIKTCIKLTKKSGIFMFTCATNGRQEHGTSLMDWSASPHTTKVWKEDYYKNLTEADIREIIDCDEVFSEYAFSVNNDVFDLYFWGIKK